MIFDSYGELNASSALIIVFQLIIAGLVLILMDELIQKGYGLGTGTSLFILTNVCYRIFDDMFNLTQDIFAGGQAWYRGAVLAFFQGVRRGDAVTPFFRLGRIPDYFGFMMMFVIIAIMIYLISIKIEIPIQINEEEKSEKYSVGLFYTSYVPVLFTSTLFAGIHMITNLLATRFGFFSWYRTGIPIIPKLPSAWYIAIFSPPYGSENVIERPWVSLCYLFLMIIFSGVFSVIWMRTTELDSKTLLKKLLNSESKIPGLRENPKEYEENLDWNFTKAALRGGLILGAIAGLAEFLGPIGTGTGLVIMMIILKRYQDIIVKEKQQ